MLTHLKHFVETLIAFSLIQAFLAVCGMLFLFERAANFVGCKVKYRAPIHFVSNGRPQ